jgi:hypothetical protein
MSRWMLTPEVTASPRPPDWTPPPPAAVTPIASPPTPYPQGRACTAQPCWETLLDKLFTYCVIQETADIRLHILPEWVGMTLANWGGTTIPPLEPVLDCSTPELIVIIEASPPVPDAPDLPTEDDWDTCARSDPASHTIWLNRDCVIRRFPDMSTPSEPEGIVEMLQGPVSPERLLLHEFGHLAGLPDAPPNTCDLMTHHAPLTDVPPYYGCAESLGGGPDDNMVHAMRERYDWRVGTETIPPPTPPPGCYYWPEGSPPSLVLERLFFCPDEVFIDQCKQGTTADWIPDTLCRLALGQ